MDSVCHFRVTLIDSVLVKILWHDYLSSFSSKKQEKVPSALLVDSSKDSSLSFNKTTEESSNFNYLLSYSQEFGKCIISILSGLFMLEHDLLSAFCMEFQENCLGLFQYAENMEMKTQSVEQVVQFILLIGQHALQTGETWPLVCLVGPMLAKSFPKIRSLVSSYTSNTSDGSIFYHCFCAFCFMGMGIVIEACIWTSAYCFYFGSLLSRTTG